MEIGRRRLRRIGRSSGCKADVIPVCRLRGLLIFSPSSSATRLVHIKRGSRPDTDLDHHRCCRSTRAPPTYLRVCRYAFVDVCNTRINVRYMRGRSTFTRNHPLVPRRNVAMPFENFVAKNQMKARTKNVKDALKYRAQRAQG